jgi:hypothetical protein
MPPEQPLPEDLSTVQSHEKPEIQYVIHVQEIISLKRLRFSIRTNIISLLNARLLENM